MRSHSINNDSLIRTAKITVYRLEKRRTGIFFLSIETQSLLVLFTTKIDQIKLNILLKFSRICVIRIIFSNHATFFNL